MEWAEKLEYAVKRDVETEPEGLKNFISDDNVLLENIARKLMFAVKNSGFDAAGKIFSKYWVNMTTTIGFNDDVSGYFARFELDRETTTPFKYTFYNIVTINGIICKSDSIAETENGATFGDDGLGKIYKELSALTLDEARAMENDENLKEFVEKIMLDFSESYIFFLKSIKNID